MAQRTLLSQRSRSQPRLSGNNGCPLERLPIQPVGTSDHYLDRCYCYLCTCGEHICPGDLRKLAAAPAVRTLPSLYQSEYRLKGSVPPHPFPLPVQTSMPMTGRMDLRTTSQMDFKPPGQATVPVHIQESLPRSLKCVTRSSYQCDFPNWKPSEAVLFKATKMPYRGDSVGFTTKSTYQDNFEANNKFEPVERKKPLKDSGPITALGEFYGQTSHKTQFRRPKFTTVSPENTRKTRGKYESEWLMSDPMRCLTTTYRREFSSKETPVRIPCKQAAKRSGALG